MKSYEYYMEIAYMEACRSIREGNHGFGAVVIDKNGEIVSQDHDREVVDKDATSHAELNAIRSASRILGHDLLDCSIVCTHEPCPMCSTAMLWAGICTIAYGYSITSAINEGRRRIDIGCKEIFDRANRPIRIVEDVLYEKCSILYKKDVRVEVKKLRGKTEEQLLQLGAEIENKRIKWFHDRYVKKGVGKNPLENAYDLLLEKLEINTEEAAKETKNENMIIIKSRNFCPTLEACKILGLDTRMVCKLVSEKATDSLFKQLDTRISFGRNYEKIRPYSDYCEEYILLK